MATILRRAYADMYGPTQGDRVRLADTELVIEVEDDYTLRAGGYGEEVKFGGGKTIRDGMAQSQRTRAEGVVRRQTKQMVRLVDDLLDVSRITHGKLVLERAPTDLVEVARAALEAATSAFSEKGVVLLTEGLDQTMPAFGDGGRLAQVFTNLLQNAIRFTPEAGSLQWTGCCASDAAPACGSCAIHRRAAGNTDASNRAIVAMSTPTP